MQHEEPLRDAIQLQLNRDEFRHILARSLFSANWGTSLSLLSNAVLVWNTVHIKCQLVRDLSCGERAH
jgi:TnpA family transposase